MINLTDMELCMLEQLRHLSRRKRPYRSIATLVWSLFLFYQL
ncbi:hypothetical protein RUM_09210 [Ruminococcus champanellensis 18P13 = JCM 17042]|uniref:Uncharacterized protein n=1 Tax=Ruminococcus champanellensis (strain DSM 18848 / JCM 17042 / KCTC 15320 / 18P13) TaxID=213810 RepID=D4LBU8_RUMC1|nr:hypothetical protein RUM_09210 [Ruminococcus champanellensis 18P13 = JCM 17042]